MANSKGVPVEGAASEADVVMNRLNVALARSQKIINSWLPAAKDEDIGETTSDQDDEDFKSMSEQAGIGSKVAFGDEGLPDGAFQRKKLSSNDKLLEQLLGKKAAQAKRKSQEAQKRSSTSKSANTGLVAGRAKQPEGDRESDDDEEGRAATFKSRATNRVRKDVQDEGRLGIDYADDAVGDDRAPEESSYLVQHEKVLLALASKAGNKPAKKRPSSYLDELLAQKSNKKNRRAHTGTS